MKQTGLAWNVSIVGTLLTVALVVAAGCPSTSTSPNAGGKKPSTQPGEKPEVAAPADGEGQRPANPSTSAQTPGAGSQSQDGATPSKGPSSAEAPGDTHAAAGGSAESATAAFDNWAKPKYAFFITGRQNGYLEPCGCAGLTNQKGGLARRHTLLSQLRDKGWEMVALDAGNQVRRYGRQAEIKFQVAAQALSKMDYVAVGFGPDDLRLSSGELIAVVSDSDGRPGPFVCANANLFGLTETHLVIEAGGERIGLTCVLGDEQLSKLQSSEIEKTSPEEGLQKVAPQLEGAGCDIQVLLANTGYEEAKTLVEKYPQFDVIVVAAGTGEPPSTPETVGKSQVLLVGEKSMYAGVLGVYDDPENRFRYQRVPLDKSLKDSEFMLKLLATYQDTLAAEGFDGLGLRPVPHPSGHEFVGSSKCGECHTKAFAVWEGTPHSHALESLVQPHERSEIPRHHDPECLSCHVTGWDPQGYFPFKSGYEGLEQSPLLHGNGCENCHGPGSRHVAAESGEVDVDDVMLMQLREQMRLPLAQAEKKCLECHDLDNDPNFQHEGAFAEYWEQIQHPGLD